MGSIRLSFTVAFAVAGTSMFGALVAFATADEGKESSLLLNPPAQSAQEVPPLPPPSDPSAAAPQADESLPAPTRARRTSVDRPFMRPVEPASTTIRQAPEPIEIEGHAPHVVHTLPAPALDGPIVRPVADIKYDTDRGARKLFKSAGAVIETLLIVENPADGCLYEIPVCLPGCCVGEPRVDGRRGLLGRGVAEYCWPCGFEIEVIFRLRGDVKVEYDA